jgi:hypothetical protein
VWISLVVPIAILVATLLLQRLEAKLLRAPEPGEHRGHPVPLATAAPRRSPSPRPRPRAAHPVARATA